jgi:hypothetical protein
MADAPKKGLALLLLGSKRAKPTEDEPKEDDASEMRRTAAEAFLAAIEEKDADALGEAFQTLAAACRQED